jgi:hypothetical protein
MMDAVGWRTVLSRRNEKEKETEGNDLSDRFIFVLYRCHVKDEGAASGAITSCGGVEGKDEGRVRRGAMGESDER